MQRRNAWLAEARRRQSAPKPSGRPCSPNASRGARWLGRQMEKRRSRLALLEMSDEQLKDIGLSRGQVYSEFKRQLRD